MKHAHIGLRVFAVLVVALAPALIMMAAGWPGAVATAHFALVGAAYGTLSGGLRFGVILTVTIALAGVVAIPLSDSAWAIAALMVVLGGIYGFWSAAGYASGAMLIPALVPYLVRDPPGIFSTDAPTINVSYLATFAMILIVTGVWTSLVLSKLVLKGKTFGGEPLATRPTISYGLLLGAIAALVVTVVSQVAPNSEWAWITYTMFILANPTGKVDPQQARERVLGTVAGLAAALVLSALPLNAALLGLVLLVLITTALVVRIEKKPYWLYVMILTPAIILMDSTGSNTAQLAEERLLFTLLGVAIIIATTLLANLAWSAYLRRRPQVRAENAPSPQPLD